MATPQTRTLGPAWAGLTLLILLAAMIWLGMALRPGWNWVAVLTAMILFVVVLGVAINKRVLGVLINERSLMSLSRLQMVLWTLLVLSAYFAIALVRILDGRVAMPLAVAIPWEVWSLVGISTASLVGTPFIYSFKKHKKPDNETRNKILEKAGKPFEVPAKEVEANKQGILYGNKDPGEAAFTDIFEGDELGNAPNVDVGKLQMFFFTIIVGVTFAVQVFRMIAGTDLTGDVALPSVDEGLLALMGISNAGYLANKGVDHTKVAQ